jgi:hypothetical protein
MTVSQWQELIIFYSGVFMFLLFTPLLIRDRLKEMGYL